MNVRAWISSGGALSLLVGLAVASTLVGEGVTREVPFSRMEGTVVMTSNGKPLPGADVVVFAEFELPDGARRARHAETDEQGHFALRGLPAGRYSITAHGHVHTGRATVVAQEGKVAQVTVLAEPSAPFVEVSAAQRVWIPDEAPRIHVNGLVANRTLHIRVFRLKEELLRAGKSPWELMGPYGWNPRVRPEDDPNFEEVSTQEVALRARDIEGRFVETITLPPLPEGLYMVQASHDVHQDFVAFQVSRIAMVTKHTHDELLAFITDIETGEPLPGIPVVAVHQQGYQAMGTTGPDGIMRAKWGSPMEGRVAVWAQHGPSLATTSLFLWDGGEKRHVFWTQTDRPVYRPGDLVLFKTTIRVRDESGYKLPEAGEATVVVYDSEQEELWRTTLPVSDSGAIHGEFRLNRALMPGGIRLEVAYRGESSDHWIPVAEYRKPEFRITVRPERDAYIRGDRARVRVEVRYFSGEPVPGVELDALVYLRPEWFGSPFDEHAEVFMDYEDDWVGDFVLPLEGVTNEVGEATFEIDTSELGDQELNQLADSTLTLQVQGTALGGRYFSGQGSFQVNRGEFDLRADFESYVAEPGVGNPLVVRARRHEDGAPASGLLVDVEFGREVWTRGVATFVREGVRRVHLGDDGTASITTEPSRAGDFVARVQAHDPRNNLVRAEARTWVFREGVMVDRPAPKMQLILDKRRYDPGDPVTALIRTAAPGGVALLTVEGERIETAKAIRLSGETTRVELVAEARLAPSATVSVAYVRDKAFLEASRTLAIDLTQRRLQVEVSPEREVAEPGERVRFSIRIRDEQGNPVQTEAAVGVVDEGVYAIREDRNDPLEAFFPRRFNQVATSHSFLEVYLDGQDKAAANIQVRTRFEDTAFWRPAVMTDAEGRATVEVQLPDNLTEWRATVTAISAATQVGRSTAQVRARKPLMARLALPMYMVEGDRQRIQGRISNESPERHRVQVRFQASGVEVSGPTTRTLELGPGRSEVLDWQVTAGRPGEAEFRLTAQSGALSDGVELRMRIQHRAFEQVQVTHVPLQGESGTWSKNFTRPRDAVDSRLVISVSPTPYAEVIGMLDYLVDFPYGCTEQTLHRFLPALAVRAFLRESGISSPELEAKVEEVAQQSLVRLRAMQNQGWGWWEFDEPQGELTGLVLMGLRESADLGYPIPSSNLNTALDWGLRTLKAPREVSADPGYQVRHLRVRVALAAGIEAHRSTPESTSALLTAPFRELDVSSLSGLVKGLHWSNQRQPSPDKRRRLQQAIASLVSKAHETETTIEWVDKGWFGETGKAIDALSTVNPADIRVEKALRYLLSVRRNQRWTSTYDTGLIVRAAARHMKSRERSLRQHSLQVLVNGEVLHSMEVRDWEDAVTGWSTSLSGEDLEQPVEIRVVHRGASAALVTVTEHNYVRDDDARPVATEGLSIRREFVRMRAERLEDGTMRLVPSPRPIGRAEAGEVFRTRLTIRAERGMSFVMVEDPIPSNSRIVDIDEPVDRWSWMQWWSRSVWRDDKAAFFITQLPAGEHVIEYAVRAESPGVSWVMPTEISQMYLPEVRARGAIQRFEVRP